MFDISYDDFTKLGFHEGDSVDFICDGKTLLEDIPFLSVCVLPEGMYCLNAREGFNWIRIEMRLGNMWEQLKMQSPSIGEILLRLPGKYINLQKTFCADFSVYRRDYLSDEHYTTYRELKTGKIHSGRFYCSASFFDVPERCQYLNKQLDRDGIKYCLNMSCGKDMMNEFIRNSGSDVPYIRKLFEENHIYTTMLSANYMSPDFRRGLAKAMRELLLHKGPYLLQCKAGLDRTGFLSILLGALAGADSKEIVKDYMSSYERLCGITIERDPDKYKILRHFQANRIMKVLAEDNTGADVRNCCDSINYNDAFRNDPDFIVPENDCEYYTGDQMAEMAENYFLKCDMSGHEVAVLKKLLIE